MLHHEYDALKGYRFLGGAISFYSVSCMSDVIFNPSLLNWSSLILTVAHMYKYIESIPYNGVSALCTLTKTNQKTEALFFHSDLAVPSSQKPWTSAMGASAAVKQRGVFLTKN